MSAEGVEQGHPLGPLLFCLTIHHLTVQLVSPFRAFYLDNGALDGGCEDVLEDLKLIESAAKQLGLHLNFMKLEVFARMNPH